MMVVAVVVVVQTFIRCTLSTLKVESEVPAVARLVRMVSENHYLTKQVHFKAAFRRF